MFRLADHTNEYQANLRRFQWLQATNLFFSVPVIVLFWRANGMNDFDIYFLQAIFAVAAALLEVPTGLVADVLGRRTSLLLGKVLGLAGWIIYALGSSFGAFLAGELTLALGMSFVSGADSALLFDSLKAMGREEEFRKYSGRSIAIQMLAMAVASVIGGVIGARSLRATLWLSILGPAVAVWLSWKMTEVKRQPGAAPAAGPATGPVPEAAESGSAVAPGERKMTEAFRRYWQLVRDSLRLLRRHRLVRWYVLFAAVLTSSSTWLLWMYQPYMEKTGVPVAMFGVAFAIFNLFAAAMSHYAHTIDTRLGNGRSLALMGGLQILSPLLMAAFRTPFSFLFILGHQAVRGINRAVLTDRVLRYVYADKRATVLSFASLAGRLAFAVTGPLIGWFSGRYGMITAMWLQGGVLVFLLGGMGLSYRRIPAKYFVVKESVRDRQ